jgi:hypothetical protein
MSYEELFLAIHCQRQIVEACPDDESEQFVLSALYTSLRRTFRVINNAPPQYVYSKSRAVLKQVR